MSEVQKNNIILVGMPGAGKSTVGVVLAKRLACEFVDTDLLIQVASHRSLQDIVDTDGYLKLRELEEQELLKLSVQKHVISTGGSAVYSKKGMAHLKKTGVCMFLDVPLSTLELRINDFSTRGIAKREDQSFAEVFEERCLLYSQYADFIISGDGKTLEEVCDEIKKVLPAAFIQ